MENTVSDKFNHVLEETNQELFENPSTANRFYKDDKLWLSVLGYVFNTHDSYTFNLDQDTQVVYDYSAGSIIASLRGCLADGEGNKKSYNFGEWLLVQDGVLQPLVTDEDQSNPSLSDSYYSNLMDKPLAIALGVYVERLLFRLDSEYKETLEDETNWGYICYKYNPWPSEKTRMSTKKFEEAWESFTDAPITVIPYFKNRNN